jgi:hypothetical protein
MTMRVRGIIWDNYRSSVPKRKRRVGSRTHVNRRALDWHTDKSSVVTKGKIERWVSTIRSEKMKRMQFSLCLYF